VLEAELLRAVLAELNEVTYSGVTFAGVATRARTSKHVLYRRWPTKSAMILAAVVSDGDARLVPDTGTLRSDVFEVLRALRLAVETVGSATILALFADLNPEDGARLWRTFLDGGTEAMQIVIGRAVERGEIGPHPIPDAAARAALTFARHDLIAGLATDDAHLQSIIDEVALPLVAYHAGSPSRIED
jgi:AcrR family transcriptional regulator